MTSGLPNFQISADTCTGSLLAPGDSCTLNVSYVPQPATFVGSGLDYFLELNTQQCVAGSAVPYCEIDSGRFPVELKTNPVSPLRMTPSAGLDFGVQPNQSISNPLTITLFNDPKDPNSATVNFKGNVVSGNFTESDNCGASLAPGASCTLTFLFTPQSVGFNQGSMSISYTVSSMFNIGVLQIYLRGTGQ
jgi:hypothetical protein